MLEAFATDEKLGALTNRVLDELLEMCKARIGDHGAHVDALALLPTARRGAKRRIVHETAELQIADARLDGWPRAGQRSPRPQRIVRCRCSSDRRPGSNCA
ncbi:hypothetical protein L1887_51708 [Cichorium endivia]|nr:hypothetical protein L1887_51708 [Cichorium endivia]